MPEYDDTAFVAALGRRAQFAWIKAGQTVQARDGLFRSAALRTVFEKVAAGLPAPVVTKPPVAERAKTAPVAAPVEKPAASHPQFVAEPRRRMTFEEQLAAIEAGTLNVVERVPMPERVPQFTGGSSLA